MKKRASILIVDDEPITRIDIRMMVEAEGFNVVGEASNGFEAIELSKKLNPDIILMDIKMPGVDGLKASEVIKNEGYAKEIILSTAYSDIEYIEAAQDNNIYGYVVKPISETNLIPLLHLAQKRSGEVDKLNNKIDSLESDLEARKLIEKAKGYIMEEKKCSEEEAYKHLRNLSMSKRCSMKELAQAIIKIYA